MNNLDRMVPIVIVMLLAALPGCGRKTYPATPDSPRPEAVRDLKVTVRDTVAYLSWSIPANNIEGKPMEAGSVRAIRIYRAELDREDRRPRFRQVDEVLMDHQAPSMARGATVTWSDRDLQYGRVYVYRLRAYSVKGGVSDYSNEARAVPLPSLSSPRNVKAQAGDGSVSLSWDAVTTRTNGALFSGYIGYNVYHGTEAGRMDETPVNRSPVTVNDYLDTSAENGKTYYYRVRAVDGPVMPWRESQDSEEVSATPQDLTPPEPPQGLTVVPGIGRVFLTWNENRERDMAGYHVYRAGISGGDAERLTASPVNRTTYSDETVKPDTIYFYFLTAVDRSGNESGRSQEFKAAAEKLR